MESIRLAPFWKIFARLRWVSLGCLMGFVIERFAYHVFDVGVLYHRSPMTLVWLLVLPLVGYCFVLLRSPIMHSSRRLTRVLVLIFTSAALAMVFFQGSLGFFAFVVFDRVQWW